MLLPTDVRDPRLLLALLAAAACSPQPEPPARAFAEVAYADGRFVAVGGLYAIDPSTSGQAYVAVSPDGDIWEVHDLPTHNWLRAVTHGNGRWIAAGVDLDNRQALLVSGDAAAWRPATSPPVPAISGLAFGNGVFVATGSTDPRFFVSTDGDTWEPINMGAYWWDTKVEFLGDRFIAYGGGAAIGESTDGRTWMLGDLGVTYVKALAAHDGGVVGVATYDCCFGEVPEGIQQIRLDGPGTWLARVDIEPLRDLSVVDGAVVGVSGVRIMRAPSVSPPWTFTPVADDVDAVAIVASGSTLVAVGTRIHVSHDGGASWSPAAE